MAHGLSTTRTTITNGRNKQRRAPPACQSVSFDLCARTEDASSGRMITMLYPLCWMSTKSNRQRLQIIFSERHCLIKKTKRRTISWAATTLVGLVLLGHMGAAATPHPEFIWLSDLHFDPTANGGLVDALAESRVDEWPRLLESVSPASVSRFGEDTNWALLSSSFEAIRKTAPDAQFVVVTGDILVHHFRERFERTAKNHDLEAFRGFTRKTMQFVAAQLATVAPGRPVLFTLGNNDSECGDYKLQPHGAFLKDASSSLTKLLGPLADETSIADWTALGSYNVPHPSLKRYRVIALNSVYFSAKYQNACSTGDTDPGQEEMHWLENQLVEARLQKNKVWLIFHIPPGIDGYATAHANDSAALMKIVPMWKPIYTGQFAKLLAQYRDTVTISLAGHEHTDDFRLIAGSVVLMTPGLSPIVGQNPAFRIVAFQRNGNLSDETTYYFSNLEMASGGTVPKWKLEYDFAQTWGLRPLNFKNFNQLYRRIENGSAVRDRWSSLYSVSHPEGNNISRQVFSWLFCATGNVLEAGYRACVERIEKEPQALQQSVRQPLLSHFQPSATQPD